MLVDWNQIIAALGETAAMVVFSLLFAILIGLPLGILLVVTREGIYGKML